MEDFVSHLKETGQVYGIKSPFLYSIHENAIKASKELGIPLIRFEREKIKINDGSIVYAESYKKAVAETLFWDSLK